MREIKPCPICGKMPKVKIDYGYEASGFGGWVTIQCKPLFSKHHLKIEEGKSTNKRALEFAIDSWNAKAMALRNELYKNVDNPELLK